MSWPFVHSAVAEPCHVSPPSSSSALRPRRLQALDQRGEMREAADLAVGPRRGGEIEIRERVRVDRAGLDAEVLEQRFADEMRRPPLRDAEARD